MSEKNRRVRLYRTTPAGRAHLRSETARWRRYTRTIDGILAAASRGG